MTTGLPTFERPPLVETVVGMQFDPIAGLTTAHLGLFWQGLPDEWTSITETIPTGQMTGFTGVTGSWLRPGLATFEILTSARMERPRPNLWEVSYVNLVPKGELWRRPDEWPAILPDLLAQARPSAAEGLLTGDARWTFAIGREKGQLHVQVEHAAMGGSAEAETLVLRLIARGEVRNGSHEELESGFVLGHESIVKTFSEIAGPRALEYWGART